MKEAGTIKNGFFDSNSALSLSNSFRFGSALEYCRNSSEIDSSLAKRSFSVTLEFIAINNYIFFYRKSRKNFNSIC